MSRRRRKRRKSRKRLAYGVIAVAFILLCFLIYFSLHQSNQTSDGNATPPGVQAAIVDHLNFTGQSNPAFVDACGKILDEGGLTWKYYRGEDVTVDFYRNLTSYGTSLIILRVHSAIMRVNDTITVHILGLFTSELYSPEAAQKYPKDVNDRRLVEAFFSEEERAQGISYFGIVPNFIEKSMIGEFKDAVVIMMGCEGLGYEGRTYTDMAEAFRKRGAKVCIGWDGLVSTLHTDNATTCLLQHLAQGKTVEEAVEKTMNEVGPEKTYFLHQGYNSTLKYYPRAAGSYTIQHILGISSTDTTRASTVLVKEEKKGTRLNRIWQAFFFSARSF